MRQVPFVIGAFTLVGFLGCAGIASAQFKVIGYAPSWEAPLTDAQLSRVTHVNYAFLNPNDGVTASAIPNSAQLSSLVSAAHAKGVKVLLSVGGWTNQDNHAFVAAGADTTSANNFANSMMSLVTQFGLDGIDIDWEWPQTTDGTDVRYATLMTAVSSKMHANGKLCTTALVGNYEPGVPSSVFSSIDLATIMAYDNGSETNHSTYSYAVSSLDYWAGRGLAPSKTALGLPFYGYSPDRSVAKKYSELVASDANAPNNDSSNGIYYNGQTTIRSKTTLAMQRVDGVMIWELGQDIAASDSRSLLYAIDGVVHAATPTPRPRATATATATTGGGCSYPNWTASASYAVGAIVKYAPNGNLYRASHANPVAPDTQAYDPTVSTYFWDPYTCTGSTPTATSTSRPTATSTARPRATATSRATATPTARVTSTPTPRATATATPRPTATTAPTATPTSSGSSCTSPAWSAAGTSYAVGQLVTYVFKAGDNNPNPGVVGKTYEYRCAFAHNNPTWTPGIAGPSVWASQRACN